MTPTKTERPKGRTEALRKLLAEATPGPWDEVDALQLEIVTALKSELAATKEKLARAVVTLAFYADPEHWTIPWIEGSHGDYGNRAREFLKTYREVGSE